MVSNKILAVPPTPVKSGNLTPQQADTLSNLKSYAHLTIKEADKGACILVMDNAHYKQMCLDILNNPLGYRPISFEELDTFTVYFYQLVDKAYYEDTITKGTLAMYSNSTSTYLNILLLA